MAEERPIRSASRRDVRRWRRYLADERAEAAAYRDLAGRRTGEERAILLALAEAERRHEAHWEGLLGDQVGPPLRGDIRTRVLGWLARRFGSVFVLALAQRAEARGVYDGEADATARMAADERIHLAVVRGLAARGRERISGSFRAAVFGANDGLVSNLALVLGIAASGLPGQAVLLTGVAGLLAGALSMGAGEYVSVSSQRELLDASAVHPRAHTVLQHLDVDANELALVYRARGMAAGAAAELAESVLSEQPAGLAVETAGDDAGDVVGTGMQAAVSSFVFFAVGALIPVLPYAFGATGAVAVGWALLLVGSALLVTGATVGVLSGASPLRRALRQLAIGFGAALATYLLGLAFGATVLG